MRTKSRKSLIAWDLDNTLFDRDAAFRQCLVAIAAARQNDTFQLEASVSRIMEFDRSGQAERLAVAELFGAELGLPSCESAGLWETVRRLLPEFVQPDQEVCHLLEELSREYRLALISNGGSFLQRKKLDRAGLTNFFDPSLILISGELECDKPDPAIFAELLKRAEASAGASWFVGDDPVNDIEGAARAGLRTCWVSRGRPTPALLKADLVVREILELRCLRSPQAVPS